MDPSALSHALRTLSRDGLIEMQRVKVDARFKLVALTDAGRAKIDECEDAASVAALRAALTAGRKGARASS
jgi:DNA-binding MarR family transcriptional regulator